jgi:hypothetical protein
LHRANSAKYRVLDVPREWPHLDSMLAFEPFY